MGKIQSAVTGAVMSTIGAIATGTKFYQGEAEKARLQAEGEQQQKLAEQQEAEKQAKKEQADQEKAEVEKIDSDAYGLYGEALEGANQTQTNNLLNRQNEANEIAKSFVKSQSFQRKAFKARLAQFKDPNSEEAKAFKENAQKLYNSSLSEARNKTMALRKRKYTKRKVVKKNGK